MIKDVWSLKLGRDIKGVRVLTKSGKYFDVSNTVYKKQLGLDPSTLPSLELMEFGDYLITQEEFDSGIIVDEGDADMKLLKYLNTFIRSSMEDDPIYKARRKQKVDELRQRYFSYMPPDWLEEFANYALDNFEGNKNIYTSLTPEQLTYVKDYFRWRTRNIFEEKKASKVLKNKLNKAKTLSTLMGDATDWQYDGTIDTGYAGGGHCELGHALRYEHYAVSQSLNKTIIFGATCMSDFFEVDKRVLDDIVKAQEILLKEIKAVVFVLNTGRLEAYNEHYRDALWDIMKYFKGTFNERMAHGAGWGRFIGGFHKSGLPLTRSLRNKFFELVRLYKQDQHQKEQEQKQLEKDRRAEERRQREEAAKANPALAPVQPEPEEPVEDDFYSQKEIAYSDTDRVAKLFNILEGLRDRGDLDGSLFGFQIIPTVRRTEKISPRQAEFLNALIDKAPALKGFRLVSYVKPAPEPVKVEPTVAQPQPKAIPQAAPRPRGQGFGGEIDIQPPTEPDGDTTLTADDFVSDSPDYSGIF